MKDTRDGSGLTELSSPNRIHFDQQSLLVEVDQQNNLCVVDYRNYRVRQFNIDQKWNP